jgi:hypothetical protein
MGLVANHQTAVAECDLAVIALRAGAHGEVKLQIFASLTWQHVK